MKKILILAFCLFVMVGCNKETVTGNKYPELYPLIDVPAKKLSSDIDFKYSISNAYVAGTSNYGVTAMGRTVAISPKNKDVTTARLLDIQKDMESHYKNKGLIKTRIVDSSKSVALDF